MTIAHIRLILIGIWILLNTLLPLSSILERPESGYPLAFHFLYLINLDWILVIALVVLAPLAHLSCASLTVQVVRNLGLHPFAIVVRLIALALVVFSFFVYALSWYFLAFRGSHLTPADFLGAYYGIDRSFVLQVLQKGNRSALRLGLLATTGLSFLLYILTPRQLTRLQFIERTSIIVLAIALMFIVRVTTQNTHDGLRNYHLSQTLRLLLNPQTSLLAFLVLPSQAPPRDDRVLSLPGMAVVQAWDKKIKTLPESPIRSIVVIAVEALRQDVIFSMRQGQPITPKLNKLARQHLYFENFRSNNPESIYSETSILTGRYPLKSDFRDLGEHLTNRHLAELPSVLQQLGFTPGIFTFGYAPLRTSLLAPDEIFVRDIDSYPELNDISLIDSENIKSWKAWQQALGTQAKSFSFLYLYSSHFAYSLPADVAPTFYPQSLPNRISMVSWPIQYLEDMRNRYFNCIHYLDEMLMNVVEFVKARQSLEQTLILITGDHGELFHEHGQVGHGGALYEPALRVPLIIIGPDYLKAKSGGKVQGAHVDIAATIVSALGLPKHAAFQGISLLEPLNPESPTQQQNIERPIFLSSQGFTFEDGVVLGKYKYVLNHVGQGERLYNLELDPQEKKNLIESEKTILHNLRLRTEQFRAKQMSYYALSESVQSNLLPPQY